MSKFTFSAERPSENYNRIDMSLFVSIFLLWGFGIFTLFVCSQNYGSRAFNDPFVFVKRQLVCSLVGFVAFIFLAAIDMKLIKKFVGILVIVSVVLCLLTFIPALSIEKNGARRWLRMPAGFSFQPSELIKFAVVLFLANYFEKQSKLDFEEDKNVLPCVIVFLSMTLLVFAQKDFSTGLFILTIGIIMFFVAGQKLMWFLPFSVIALPASALMVTLKPYRLRRIIGWIRPDEFASTINYQSQAAKRAISAGGLWGNGIGVGLIKINSIPEIQADYIFAGWAEAMGFAGVLLYFALLGFFAWRGYRTAFSCRERFSAYGAFGCVSLIFLQSLLNVLVVSGLLPSTGIPLPFFSLGGSSIIVTLAMCGFLLNASRCEKNDEEVFRNDEIYIDDLAYL